MEVKKPPTVVSSTSKGFQLKAPPKLNKPVEIPKGITHKDMIGRIVEVHLKDRLEQTFTGQLTSLSEHGPVMTGVLRGRKPYVDLIPWSSVSFITCNLSSNIGDSED